MDEFERMREARKYVESSTRKQRIKLGIATVLLITSFIVATTVTIYFTY